MLFKNVFPKPKQRLETVQCFFGFFLKGPGRVLFTVSTIDLLSAHREEQMAGFSLPHEPVLFLERSQETGRRPPCGAESAGTQCTLAIAPS